MAIETPQYRVINKNKQFELRLYAPYINAQVEVQASDHRDAANKGFGLLAGYIFGENVKAEKIQMTAPVMAQSSSEKIAMTAPVMVSGKGVFQVSFVMPSRYTMESLPKPKDSRIKFIQKPERTMAVIRFRGPFGKQNFDRNLKKLHYWIEAEKFHPKGDAIIAGYDPPFTPWFLKHNEILIEVE
jgi:hypothetical protein